MSNRRAGQPSGYVSHRADYTFEIGSWHAKCRICGHHVTDKDRRRLAAEFRQHIQEMAEAAAAAAVIDLRARDSESDDSMREVAR